MTELESPDLRTEEPSFLADQPPDAPPTVKALMVKYGWLTGLAGMGISVVGSWLLSRDAAKLSLGPRVIHTTGLLIMLGGAGVALLGYRLPWLSKIFGSLFAVTQHGSNDMSHTGTAGYTGQSVKSLSIAALCAGPPLAMILVVVLWLVPNWLAGLVIYFLSVVFAVAAVITISSGNKWQRAFALGAMVPLLGLCVQLWFTLPMATARSGGYGSNYPPGAFGELAEMGRVIEYVGTTRAGTVLTWFTSAFAGVVAVAVRAVLYRINELPRKSGGD